MNPANLLPNASIHLASRWFHVVTAVTLLFAGSVQSGCTTTMHPSPFTGLPQLIAEVKPGDHVRGVRHDGSKFSFKVTARETTGLVGEKQRVLAADISRLEVRRFSPGKTALAVVSLVALGLTAEAISDLAFFPALAPWP